MIETAAKLIKTDIKSVIEPVRTVYPKATDMKMEATLENLPNIVVNLLMNPTKLQETISLLFPEVLCLENIISKIGLNWPSQKV